MRFDIVPGAVFPDYELSDHTGKRRKLSDLQQQDPMVLVLSRGAFCLWQQGRKELFYPYGKTYIQALGEEERSEVQ